MKNILSIFLMSISGIAFAQSGTVSAGGDVKQDQGSLSFSIGQVFTQSPENSTHSEGLQQAYEIFQVPPTVSSEELTLLWDVKVYPNPTTDFVILALNENAFGANFYLVSMDGKLLDKGVVSALQTKFFMADKKTGVYLLHLQNAEGQTLVHRIVKH